MCNQIRIQVPPFVSFSSHDTKTDALPQKASAALFQPQTKASPSPFIITFHRLTFNESLPTLRRRARLFPSLCAGRSVNASAHYLRPSLPFFFSKPARHADPSRVLHFFFFSNSSLQLHPPPFTQAKLVMMDPPDASEK